MDEHVKSVIVVPIVSFIGWMWLYGNQPDALRNASLFSAFVAIVIAVFGRM